MQQLRFVCSIFAMLVFWLPVVSASPESSDTQKVKTGKPLAELIEALDSPEFAERQRATRELAVIGQPAVEPLLEAAQQGSLEVAVRTVSILESIYLNGDDSAVDAAELALERLTTVENRSAATRAGDVLNRHADYRQQRALVQIEKLGARIKYVPRKKGIRPPAGGRGSQPPVAHIELTPAWTGGDEGLKYFKRLKASQPLVVYRIEGEHVSEKGIKGLQAALPNLVVQYRGSAILGVTAETPFPVQGGCLVKEVGAGSAADEGGIRPKDIITVFGGKEITSFDELVERIKQYKPGDEVELTVLRGAVPRRVGGARRLFQGGKTVELKVKLKGWTE